MTNCTLGQNNSCRYCGSKNLSQKTNLIGVHWGEVWCTTCNRHLQWLTNPVITTEQKNRQQLIDMALDSDRINGWESLFLRNIQPRRYLTPKQQEKFNQISARHGFTKIPASNEIVAGGGLK